MSRLLRFLKKYYVLFLFLLLEGAALSYYIESTSYTRANTYAVSNIVAGTFRELFSDVSDYFSLRKENERLVAELAEARNELSYYRDSLYNVTDYTAVTSRYSFIPAKIISNSITRQENYFVLNKGLRDGAEPNMAVLSTGGGVAGYIQDCSDSYSVCMSIINRDFRIGGRLKGKEHFGSVFWDGVSPRYVTLSDIPHYAAIEKGDTILSAYSLRFPPDSFIGTVDSYRESVDGTYFEVKVKLGTDMSVVSDVMLVRFSDMSELDELAGEQFLDSQPHE